MKIKVKSILFMIIVATLAGIIAMATLLKAGSNSEGIDEEAEYVVGLSIHFMQDDYTVDVVNGFEEVMREEDVKTIIMNANGDAKKQVADIEELIRQDVDAIGICPLDDSAVRQSLVKAKEAGITVVTITEIAGVEADAIVYGREYENGYGSGKRLVKALKDVENAEVAILDFPYEVGRMNERIDGFKAALEGTDIQIAEVQRCDSNEAAMDYVRELLERNPNIRGLFCTYSNAVIGAGAACKALNRRDIVAVGVDADMIVLKFVKEGWIEAVTAQFPAEHGKYCAQAIMELLNGAAGQKRYLAPYQIVDQDNAAQMAKRLWNKEL